MNSLIASFFQKDLRQGDPLSPYLFLLVTKRLHALFKKAEDDGVVKGVSLCVASPQISHLLFADDSLVFCRVATKECVQLQSLLHMYEQALGHSLNKGKTNIFSTQTLLSELEQPLKTSLVFLPLNSMSIT